MVRPQKGQDTLLENPDLLQETIEKYSVRSLERQLEIDLLRGYERVVPLEYFKSLRKYEPKNMIIFQA